MPVLSVSSKTAPLSSSPVSELTLLKVMLPRMGLLAKVIELPPSLTVMVWLALLLTYPSGICSVMVTDWPKGTLKLNLPPLAVTSVKLSPVVLFLTVKVMPSTFPSGEVLITVTGLSRYLFSKVTVEVSSGLMVMVLVSVSSSQYFSSSAVISLWPVSVT